MNLSSYPIVISHILFTLQSFKLVQTVVDWETANEHCRSQNDSLPDINDVKNHSSYPSGPIWSSVKEHFTPWIAYRGCFKELVCKSSTGSHLPKKNCHFLQNNNAGNCYFECKSKNNSNGGCADNVNFFFGLQISLCLCLCEKPMIKNISESAKCNISCGASRNTGECGGIDYFSMYESMNVSLPDSHLGGFCLTCKQQSDPDNILLYSIECNEKARGHCVMSNGSVSLTLTMSTFASYWNQCRNRNLYIIGDTRRKFCQKEENNAWTGLRKYKIDDSNFHNETCYIIEMRQNSVNYVNGNCTKKINFLCKNEIGFIITTPVSPSRVFKSEENTGIMIGASIAGVVVLLSVVFLIICLLKKREFHCMKSNQQQAKRAKVFNNTTYDDLVIRNQKPDFIDANKNLKNDNQQYICNIDDIYVEKEEEYDHLHTSRQKHVTTQADEVRYGSASYLEENSYSMLRQSKDVMRDLNNEYSVINMPYSI